MTRSAKACSEMKTAVEEIMTPMADAMRKAMEHTMATMAGKMRKLLQTIIHDVVSTLLPVMVKLIAQPLESVLKFKSEC